MPDEDDLLDDLIDVAEDVVEVAADIAIASTLLGLFDDDE
jgi:hypothetical protein